MSTRESKIATNCPHSFVSNVDGKYRPGDGICAQCGAEVIAESNPAVHTPTPWFYDEKFPSSVWTKTGVWVASTNVESTASFEERAANARLIVRSVNSHKALMEALRGLLPFVHEDGMEGETAFERAVLTAERALALAEEQK